MTRVVKVGGRVQADPRLTEALVAAWRAEPGALCVVHGGGDDVSALQRAVGETPHFVNGRRVTTPRDLELLRMALSGAANKRLVAALVAAGVNAVGISGEDAACIGARALAPQLLGAVGVPMRVNAALLRHLLAGGYLPVVSPMSADVASISGGALNVNADDAAAAVAAALGVRELVLVADVCAVHAGGQPLASLCRERALELVASGEAAGGMAPKLEAALFALEQGVQRVRIGDLAAIGDESLGTVLTRSRNAA